MAIAHLLPDFGSPALATAPLPDLSDSALEDQKLASFEQGYTAGWDDSLKLQTDEHARITGVLARNLEDLSFTYEEAYSQMLNSVTPVFDAMVNQVLPDVMKTSIGSMVAEEIKRSIGEQRDQPVTLWVPSGCGAALQPLVGAASALPVTICEDASLVDGQVYLRIGDVEREFDADGLLSQIQTAVSAFSYDVQAENAHG